MSCVAIEEYSLTNLFIHFNRLPAGINLSNIAHNLRLNPIRQTAISVAVKIFFCSTMRFNKLPFFSAVV